MAHSVYYLAILDGSTYYTTDGIEHYFMSPLTRFNTKQSKKYLTNFINDKDIHIIINQCGPTPKL